MLNIGEGSSKFVKIWSIEDKGKYAKAQVSSSQKNKEGQYENSSWNMNFVGKAKDKILMCDKGDTIEITQGGVSNSYNKEKKETYYNLVVFDFEVTNRKVESQGSNDEGLPY